MTFSLYHLLIHNRVHTRFNTTRQNMSELLSPTEEAILSEYERLDLNLRSLADEIRELTEGPSQVLSEQLSELQTKVYVIRTLIKSSVYNYAKMKGQEME